MTTQVGQQHGGGAEVTGSEYPLYAPGVEPLLMPTPLVLDTPTRVPSAGLLAVLLFPLHGSVDISSAACVALATRIARSGPSHCARRRRSRKPMQ